MPELTNKTPVKNLIEASGIDFAGILGEVPSVKTRQDFLDAVERIPSGQEHQLSQSVIDWVNEQERKIEDKPKKNGDGSKMTSFKVWDGVGTPFRLGTKYHEVFEILLAGTHSRQELQQEFLEKYGEKTGNTGNIGTFVGNTTRKVAGFYNLIRDPSTGKEKLIPVE